MACMARVLGRRILPLKNQNFSRSFICTSSKRLADADTVTHTGQDFDKNDYKRVRFTDREKTVNEQFAIDLIDDEPPTEVDSHVVWCDGGGAALGHPKVYINLNLEKVNYELCRVAVQDQDGPHACGYCGLRYIMKGAAH